MLSAPSPAAALSPMRKSEAVASSVKMMWVEHLQTNYSCFRLFSRVELSGQRGWIVLRFLSHITRLLSRKIEPISFRGCSTAACVPSLWSQQHVCQVTTDRLFEWKLVICRAHESQLKKQKRILASFLIVELVLNHLPPQLLLLPPEKFIKVCLNGWVPQRTVFKAANKTDFVHLSITRPSLCGHLGHWWGAIQNELNRLWR